MDLPRRPKPRGCWRYRFPKTWVPPYRAIGSPTTNLLNVLGRYAEINVPRIAIAGRASTNLLRIAGRVNPYAAVALGVIDVGLISYNTYQCYQQGGSGQGGH